jgi:hypothetical protein
MRDIYLRRRIDQAVNWVHGQVQSRTWLRWSISLKQPRTNFAGQDLLEELGQLCQITRKKLCQIIRKVTIEVARALKPIFLNRQTNRPLHTLPRASHLALKGYPSERGQVDETRALLTNRSYLTDGRYLRPDERTGLHQVRYFQENHLIKDHNGMCGAPWIVGNCEDEKWSSLLAGVHAEGGQEYMAIFIGADVLIERLTQIQ